MLNPGKNELRKVYVNTLLELREKDENIVVLEADLAGSIGTKAFAQKYPESFVNCGIMEANMVCVAAGLALAGKKPFLHTFGPFATRRVFDQIFISLAYAGLSAVIVGSDAGVTAEYNGGTHMPFEDAGIMRLLHNCTVAEPSDEIMMGELLKTAYQEGGLWYIRTTRKALPLIYQNGEKFVPGQAKLLKDGGDASIMAYGISVADALTAALELKEEGIEAAVLDMFTLNPLDTAAVEKYASKPIITVENHSVTGGLGTAVAEVIAEKGLACKLTRLGVRGRYGQTGSADFLKKDYGFDKDSIKAAVRKAIHD